MKFLSRPEYESLKRKASEYDDICNKHWWFSQWDFLQPIWDCFFKNDGLNMWMTRDLFEKKLWDFIGTTKNYVYKLEKENKELKSKLEYFHSIVRENSGK